MTSRRFEVTLVPERRMDDVPSHPSETIPLIHVESAIPSPPLIPSSFSTINETNKTPTKLSNTFQHTLKPQSESLDVIPFDTPSPSLLVSPSTNNLTVNGEMGKYDSNYSTVHSNVYDTNSLRLTNKFLHELRMKRRELREKANDLPIDQRIALNRDQRDRQIMRAQDIFAVHFEINDTENFQTNYFNEAAQEKIRNNIFNELDRQRMKRFDKKRRQLVLGRALLMFITSLFLFMAITLVYVVIDLYDRANFFESTFPELEFISMVNDKTPDS